MRSKSKRDYLKTACSFLDNALTCCYTWQMQWRRGMLKNKGNGRSIANAHIPYNILEKNIIVTQKRTMIINIISSFGNILCTRYCPNERTSAVDVFRKKISQRNTSRLVDVFPKFYILTSRLYILLLIIKWFKIIEQSIIRL